MPTYAYRCKSCAYEFEELQKFSDKPLVSCPRCKKKKLARVIGGAGFVFKGSGFYLTDYKKKPAAEGEAKPPAPKETKSDGKGETKPQDTTPPKKKDTGSKK